MADDDNVLRASVEGAGVRFRPEYLFDGMASNAFIPVGSPIVPFDGYLEHHTGAANLRMDNLISRIILIKIGEIEPDPQSFDTRTMISVTVSDFGLAFTAQLTGTKLSVQCPGQCRPRTTERLEHLLLHRSRIHAPPVPFQIHLDNYVENPAGSFARAHIRLEGSGRSRPIEPLRRCST